MEIDVLWDTSIVCVEVPVVPLELGLAALLTVLPVIVDPHGYHVVPFLYIWSKVKSDGTDSVLM